MSNWVEAEPKLKSCLFCKSPAIPRPMLCDMLEYQCPRCGKYGISLEAFTILYDAKHSDRQKANMSGWLSENHNCEINLELARHLGVMENPSFHERSNKLLIALEKKTSYAGESIRRDDKWISWAWCMNDQECASIVAYLQETKRITEQPGGGNFKIAPDGWAHLEELRKNGADSQQGFVAMWFDPNMTPLYNNVISKAVEDAGYRPHRVDRGEHNNKIDDEIIAQIRRSRFVVADFTGQRGGVYYEAGFAQGLGLEVFWTCRKDEIEKLHFDIRQYNCIDWECDKLPEFRKRLANRIESVLGRGMN